MFKFLAVSFFVLCTIKSGLPLKCYTCMDCDSVSPSQSTCPSEAPNCGKISIAFGGGEGNQHELVTKGCFPEMNGQSCKSFVEGGMGNTNFFMKQALQSTLQILQNPNMQCDFCIDKDLCNSSNVVFPSILTFVVLAILAKLL